MTLRTLILCTLTGIYGTRAFAAPAEVNTDVIQNQINEGATVGISLGRFAVVACGNGIQSKEEDGFKNICQQIKDAEETWQRIGLVQIKKSEPNSRCSSLGESARLDIVCSFQASTRFVVEPTDAGKKFLDPKNPSRLSIPVGTATVDRVIRKAPFKRGADDYELVLFTFKFKNTDITDRWERETGTVSSPERKARAVFKFDPFSDKWEIAAVDVADRAAEFKTDHVGRVVPNHLSR